MPAAVLPMLTNCMRETSRNTSAELDALSVTLALVSLTPEMLMVTGEGNGPGKLPLMPRPDANSGVIQAR